MKVLRIVFMRTLRGRRIETETRIIEGFETYARRVITHDCVGAEELKKRRTFDLCLVGRGDGAQQSRLFFWKKAYELLTLRFDGKRIRKRKAPAEWELNSGIVSHHVIDEFDHARIVSAGRFIARNNKFSESIEQAVFRRREELRLIGGGFGSR